MEINSDIKSLVSSLVSGAKTDEEKIKVIYFFVRDEIKFGWIYPEDIPVEKILKNKKGVCMQKANLLVTMAKEAGLKARFCFMYVHKNALEDFLPKFAYQRWIDPFPHTFPEVYLDNKWVSMEATFDKELYDICLKKKINFGKYENIVKNISIDFSINGVKGSQQYFEAEGKDLFYGDDLSEFMKFMKSNVPWWKKIIQPFIFRKAQKIMDDFRNEQKLKI
jgi:transglutaminase-like putative cysteine protease